MNVAEHDVVRNVAEFSIYFKTDVQKLRGLVDIKR